ncbi:MAG: histidine phosphatase family protein [Promethearchaeota archaeon]
MGERIYFLRHAEALVNSMTPPSKWLLSSKGKEAVQLEIVLHKFPDIQHIYCSTEPKTLQTIQKFANSHKISLDIHSGLGEIHFTTFQGNYDTFLGMKREGFQNLDENKYGTESFRAGLKRFTSTLAYLKDENPGKNLLIVSHGTVLSLYFAAMRGKLEDGHEIYQKWKKLRFLAWGLLENGKIVRDIS